MATITRNVDNNYNEYKRVNLHKEGVVLVNESGTVAVRIKDQLVFVNCYDNLGVCSISDAGMYRVAPSGTSFTVTA